MPNTKLTFDIPESIMDKANDYASRRNISLSKIVEQYLASLTDENSEPVEISPWVKDLAAVTKPTPDFDHKEMYRDHILEKYSK
jgi:hypothetical protein